MARYSHLRRLPLLGGVVAAAVVALSALPAGATIVCLPGHKPPEGKPYCTNVKPTATTLSASNVKGTSATLNGLAGPNVTGGDITNYYFRYGKTTSYGKQTKTGKVGTCPSGVKPPNPSCSVPKTQPVSANISKLTPCTTYHYRLFANNPDGSFKAADRTLKTKFAKPAKNVKTPGKVKHGAKFKVKFTLQFNTKVTKIFMKQKNGVAILKTYKYGSLRAGNYTKTIKAPKNKGNYIVEVFAKLSCGQHNIKNKLKVT